LDRTLLDIQYSASAVREPDMVDITALYCCECGSLGMVGTVQHFMCLTHQQCVCCEWTAQ